MELSKLPFEPCLRPSYLDAFLDATKVDTKDSVVRVIMNLGGTQKYLKKTIESFIKCKFNTSIRYHFAYSCFPFCENNQSIVREDTVLMLSLCHPSSLE